jgi:hypothetical protein
MAVVGVVDTLEQAERSVGNLKEAGFVTSDISVLTTDARGAFPHDPDAPEAFMAGPGASALLGGGLGLLAGIGALAIPGLGPFLAAGPILAALSGATAGAAVGVVAGTLVGFGIPEIEATIYEAKLAKGHVLVAVHTSDALKSKIAQTILLENGADSVSAVQEAAIPNRVQG